MIIIVYWFSCNNPLILSGVNETLILSTDFRKIPRVSNFTKNPFIRRVTKPRVAFRNFFQTLLKSLGAFLSRHPKQQGLFVGFGLFFFCSRFLQLCEQSLLPTSRHVWQSVRTEQLGSHWTDFHEIWYPIIFGKCVMKIQVSLNSDKNNRYFTWIVISVQQLCSRLDSPKEASPSIRLAALVFQLLTFRRLMSTIVDVPHR